MHPATLLAIGGIALSLAIFGWVWWSQRLTPAEKERQRRQMLHQEGRIIEALVTGVDGLTVFYQYSLRGVHFDTAQDCSGLEHLLPEKHETLVGPASCKYHRSNPGNSIVICEGWSGLSKIERTTTPQ